MAKAPQSRVWASQVDAVIREYVNARIVEETTPLRDDIEALRGALLSLRETAQFSSGNLIGRLNNIEELLSMSASRIAQLRALAKEDGE